MESKFHLVSNLIQYLSLIILSPAFESANNSANDTSATTTSAFSSRSFVKHDGILFHLATPDRLLFQLCGHCATGISIQPKNPDRSRTVRICDVTGGRARCRWSHQSFRVSRSIDRNLFITSKFVKRGVYTCVLTYWFFFFIIWNSTINELKRCLIISIILLPSSTIWRNMGNTLHSNNQDSSKTYRVERKVCSWLSKKNFTPPISWKYTWKTYRKIDLNFEFQGHKFFFFFCIVFYSLWR